MSNSNQLKVIEIKKPQVIEDIALSIVEGLERERISIHYFQPSGLTAYGNLSESGFIKVGSHPYCEIAYVARGRGVFTIEGRVFDARAEDLFIIRPYELHGIRPDQDDPFDIAWFSIYPKEMAGWVSMYLWREKDEVEKPIIHLDKAYEFWDMLGQVLKEMSLHSFKYETALRAELLQMFIAFTRKLRAITGEERSSEVRELLLRQDRKRWREVVETAIEFIKQNYWRRINLETIARRSYLSPNYFCEVFKAETGVTFTEYLIKVRLRKAKELLRTTDLTISEISDRVGYESIHYFSRLFKEREGISPREYRELVR